MTDLFFQTVALVTNSELLAGGEAIIGIIFTGLFIALQRQRRPTTRQFPRVSDTRPDLISRVAGLVLRLHNVISAVLGLLLIATVLAVAVVDSLVRTIVLITLAIMLGIALIGLTHRHRRSANRRRRESGQKGQRSFFLMNDS